MTLDVARRASTCLPRPRCKWKIADDKNLSRREWRRALEALKRDAGLPGSHHGKIRANGDYVDDAGEVIGNLLEFTP